MFLYCASTKHKRQSSASPESEAADKSTATILISQQEDHSRSRAGGFSPMGELSPRKSADDGRTGGATIRVGPVPPPTGRFAIQLQAPNFCPATSLSTRVSPPAYHRVAEGECAASPSWCPGGTASGLERQPSLLYGGRGVTRNDSRPAIDTTAGTSGIDKVGVREKDRRRHVLGGGEVRMLLRGVCVREGHRQGQGARASRTASRIKSYS